MTSHYAISEHPPQKHGIPFANFNEKFPFKKSNEVKRKTIVSILKKVITEQKIYLNFMN